VIPIRDTVPARRTPVVTWGLIAANVLAFAYMVLVEQASPSRADFYDWLARWTVIPRELMREHDARALVSVFTAMFLHAGLLHLGGNMLFLWIFGDNVEDMLGRVRFLGFYLFCGLIAFAAQIAVDPTSGLPMLGASGAIAGVLGAYLVLLPRARVLTIVPIFVFAYFVEVPAWVFLFVWFFFQNLAPAQLARHAAPGADGGVAYWAHIAGFLAGAAIAWLWKTTLRRGGDGGERPRPQVLVDWDDWSRRKRARDWYRDWRRGE
jgi:membrane associated rhomboid family serine protease